MDHTYEIQKLLIKDLLDIGIFIDYHLLKELISNKMINYRWVEDQDYKTSILYIILLNEIMEGIIE